MRVEHRGQEVSGAVGVSDPAKGVAAMVLACMVWGLSPLYYAQLKHVPAMEVLAYRGIWSLVFFGAILGVQGRVGAAIGAARAQFLIVFVAAVMIAANWFGFIFAIQTGQGVEASLGYFILPLVAVLLGGLFFGERLSRLQKLAVGLAFFAVVVLTWGLGVAPWIALFLAATFAVYGVIKKQLDLGPVISVTAEVLILAPIAVAYLIYTGAVFDYSIGTHALLALSGPITATPLILFSFAAKRAALSTIGLVQYLNPTLQFSCAVLVLGEVITGWHVIAFSLIWVALALYSVVALRQESASRNEVSSAATSGTTVT